MAQQSELLVVQIGDETTWGSATTQTVKMAAITDITVSPAIEVGEFPTLEGLAPIYNAAVVKDGGEASLSGIATFEQLPYWLESLLGEDASPSGTTTYTRVYNGPHETAVTPKFYTLYYGTGSAGYSLLGAIVNTLEISGSAGEEVQYSVGFVGKAVAADTADSCSDVAVVLAVASDVEFSIDDWDVAFGTTGVDCTAYSFNLSLNANRNPIYALGSITPCETYHQRFEGTLDLTLEFPGASNITKTLVENLLSGPTMQQHMIQILINQAASRQIQIDFAGTLMEAPDFFSDSDGISTIELSFTGTYNSAQSAWCDITVLNLDADLWA